MRRKNCLVCLAAALSYCLSMPILAYTPQTQRDSPLYGLSQLRQQALPVTGATENPQRVAATTITPRRNDLQTTRRDDTQSLDNWQGSFALNDSATRIKIGGFVELDIIHDNNAIQSKGQLIADTIPTRNASITDGADGQTNFSISPSRLYIETRTPIDGQRLKTFISIDMFADELGVDAKPRLRQAYVELSDALFGGDLLIGQAWSTTTDLESTPDVLDFNGVENLFGQRQPQIRWSRPLSDGVKLMLAAETASNHIIEGADSITRLPDAVIAVTWDSNRFKLMGSLIVKDLRASVNNGPVESTPGFGGSLSGKVRLPYGRYQDDFMFAVTYGKGIGSHFNNAQADAVFDSNNASLEAISLYGVTLGYSHGWRADLRSTFTYCCIEIDNDDAQAAESLQGTEFSSGNLVWDMNSHWLIGIEGIWGKRDDKDDEVGTVFRTQLTSRISF